MSNSTVANVSERAVSFPDSLATPATYLVTGTIDPGDQGLCIRLLQQYCDPDDGALVVSTTESGAKTIDQSRSLCPQEPGQRLGVIDTISREQHISALYEEVPAIYTPTPRDLERIVMALSELTTVVRAGGSRHLVIRSLTPSFSETNTDDVCRFLDRVLGLRTGSGLALVGLNLSAHDDAVVRKLLQRVDGVLWATGRSDSSIEVTAHSTRNLPGL